MNATYVNSNKIITANMRASTTLWFLPFGNKQRKECAAQPACCNIFLLVESNSRFTRPASSPGSCAVQRDTRVCERAKSKTTCAANERRIFMHLGILWRLTASRLHQRFRTTMYVHVQTILTVDDTLRAIQCMQTAFIVWHFYSMMRTAPQACCARLYFCIGERNRFSRFYF